MHPTESCPSSLVVKNLGDKYSNHYPLPFFTHNPPSPSPSLLTSTSMHQVMAKGAGTRRRLDSKYDHVGCYADDSTDSGVYSIFSDNMNSRVGT